MIYRPDGWSILKLTENDGRSYYKIFATWRFGDENWRISSCAYDASNIKATSSNLLWPQLSGSIYELPLDGQNGRTFYQSGVMQNIIKMAEQEGFLCEQVFIEDVLGYRLAFHISR